MTIYEQLNNILVQALRNKDELKKNIVRNIKTKITEYLVSNKLPRDNVSDDTAIIVMKKYKKSLEKAADMMDEGPIRREYYAEIHFCEQYLPSIKDQEREIEEVVDQAIEEIGANGPKDMGRIMGIVMKNNNFDGKIVKKIVSNRLKRN